MKKTTIGTGSCLISTLLCSTFLQADVSDAQMRSLENRVNALEQKKGSSNALNPSGRPQVRDGIDLFFKADWLIWQAHENGLGYATVAQSSQPVQSALYGSSVENMEFDWDFGFRLGIGWNTPHDGWDLGLNWTWFQNNAKGSESVNSSSILLPSYGYEPAVANVSGFRSANTNWILHLNLIDLDLGREFFVSKRLTLRPFIGIRSGWVRQRQRTTFTGAVSTTTQNGSYLQGKSNFWGIGPRAGLNTEWGLGCGISLFGNAGYSLLNGFFHTDTYNSQLFSSGAHNDAVTNVDGFRVARSIGEIALGVRYDVMFDDDRLHFGAQVGWEQLMLFGQNQFKRFIGTSAHNAGTFVANQGDLTIQGWTISVRLDF